MTSADGEATALEVSGTDGFSATIYLNSQTHRPFLLEYGCLSRSRVAPGEAKTPLPSKPGSASELVWQRIPCGVYLDDFRQVSGLWIPHVWRHTQNGRPTWEWRFDKVRVVFARQ